MIVGPNWKGEKPAGITAVVRSSTELVFAVPRIFKDDTAEDTKAIQSALSEIQFYPLSEFDRKMKTKDWSNERVKLLEIALKKDVNSDDSGRIQEDTRQSIL